MPSSEVTLLLLLALFNLFGWATNLYLIYAESPGRLKYFNAAGNPVSAGVCIYTAITLI